MVQMASWCNLGATKARIDLILGNRCQYSQKSLRFVFWKGENRGVFQGASDIKSGSFAIRLKINQMMYGYVRNIFLLCLHHNKSTQIFGSSSTPWTIVERSRTGIEYYTISQ